MLPIYCRHLTYENITIVYIVGLVQDYSNSFVLAMELLQSCTWQSICPIRYTDIFGVLCFVIYKIKLNRFRRSCLVYLPYLLDFLTKTTLVKDASPHRVTILRCPYVPVRIPSNQLTKLKVVPWIRMRNNIYYEGAINEQRVPLIFNEWQPTTGSCEATLPTWIKSRDCHVSKMDAAHASPSLIMSGISNACLISL